jgi:hypothetical protein
MSSIDTLIIGGGLTGLFLAHRLHHGGQRVSLVEARPELGGRSRRSTGLEFIPATNENVALLEWVKSVSPVPFNFSVREHRPQLYDEGRWRPFAGFGDAGFLSITELSQYSHSHDIVVEPGIEHLVRALIEQLPFEAQTMSEVTGLKIEDGKVTEVVVNGDKTLKPERVVFTPHPALLNNLIEGDGLNAKNRTRLAKMQVWTAVMLELQHPEPLAEDSSIRIFTHSAKEFEPVVGRVFGNVSRWMTLVPGEREAEHEFVGQCIRHIKRQLKRAWPNAFDTQVPEKILVQANSMGQQSLKTKENFRFPEIPNLFIGSHILGNQGGEVGSLEIVRDLQSIVLGGTPAPKSTRESGAEEF